MSTLAASPTVRSGREMGMRARPDLVITEAIFRNEPCWIVKDPVGLKYFRLRSVEHAILTQLNGQHSLTDVRQNLAQRFPHLQIEKRQVHQLVETFNRQGLLLTRNAGQNEALQRREKQIRKRERMRIFSSLIAIRFPGFDPERLLNFLYPFVAWAFTRFATCCFLGLIVAALALVGINLDAFQARLPEFSAFFGLNNLLYMGVILIVTKTIHELGHGLACKHFGGECHQMGCMLMVLTPAMYCDTSDSWILANKWHRIAIGAAGMWVEVVLAAAATFAWFYTEPGWFHYAALNIVFLCSLATLAFNLNPLLRYDGYYMLSDFWELPNLSQRANQLLLDYLRNICLGMDRTVQEPPATRRLLVAFGILSFTYRWFVLVMIGWFVWQVLEPLGLQIIALGIVAMTLAGAVISPLFRLVKFMRHPGHHRQMRLSRVILTTVILVAMLGAFCFVPVADYVPGDFVIRPDNASSLYVRWPGQLKEIRVQYGAPVKEGDLLATLESTELRLQVEKLKSELARQQALLQSYRANTRDALQAARLAGEAQAQIRLFETQLEQRTQQLESLNIVADRDGVLLPPPNRLLNKHAQEPLPKWSGLPLSAENLGAHLERETLVGYIGTSDQHVAEVVLPEASVKYVQAGQSVELMLRANRGTRMSGTVRSVSSQPLAALPRELSTSNAGPLAPDQLAPREASLGQLDSTDEVPLVSLFEANVTLTATDTVTSTTAIAELITPGTIGRAKISVGHRPLGQQWFQSIVRKIRFR